MSRHRMLRLARLCTSLSAFCLAGSLLIGAAPGVAISGLGVISGLAITSVLWLWGAS